ncbi:FUSC family protein [Martelella mangrovi]|uniref:Membrane protein YccC n=1 Tax=Martelella mangrovi TaxID=1397477 RepID=A0ABV2I772_9HYPH
MLRTSQWIHNLALLKPTPYRPWRHSIRLSLGTGVPLLIGQLSGHTGPMLYVALGGFLAAVTVRLDPYRERFRQLGISALIGATGCLIGPEVGGHGLATIALLMTVGLLSGLVSGYGAAFSTGALNMLVLAVVNAHAPAVLPAWLVFVNYLAGAAFVAAMLGIGALFERDRPERRMLANIVTMLARLARASEAVGKVPTPDNRRRMIDARRALSDATKTAYATLIEKRSHGRARTRDTLKTAAVLSLVNQLSMAIIAARGHDLAATANKLDAMARAYMSRAGRPSGAGSDTPQPDQTIQLAERLAATMWPSPAARDQMPADQQAPTQDAVFSASLATRVARRLVLGREVVISALRLSLCMGLAVALSHVLPGDHSYWLPMTVAIVLKPDFGSVFLRAIHRSLGTLAGVAIALAIAALVPKGIAFVPVIMLLCAVIPFAGLRSYAVMVTFLTPVILLMIDLVSSGPVASYDIQRLADTLAGSAIALVFGYLIWPRSQERQLGRAFSDAMEKIGAYLAAATVRQTEDEAELAQLRQNLLAREFAASRTLSDLRTVLGRLVAEPPPAGREAAAWFPAIAGAERLSDAITVYAEGRRMGDPPPDADRALRAEKALAAIADDRPGETRPGGREKDDRFGDVEAEIAWIWAYLRRRPGQKQGQSSSAEPAFR